MFKAFYDFFFAVGIIVVIGAVAAITFNNGEINNLSTGWIFFPACIYAWLRGELFHWPKEEPTK